ncbi:MAG: hypothetical protein RMJ86_10200 [Anaerolineae bacterium]|nr:hypothetical protein [Anaerolineae bacterium]
MADAWAAQRCRGAKWGAAFGVLSLAIFAIQVALFWPFTIDDAFITFRYIRQFVAGNGLVFNIGERVEGYSNFLWLMLLSPFHALGLDLVVVAKAIGVLLAVITLWLTAQLAAPLGCGWIAALLLVATAPFAVWAVGGLETMLFACLFAASALAFVQEEETGKGAWSGVLFALLALTRPEGVLFGALAAALRAAKLWRERRAPAIHDWWRLGLWLAPPLVHLAWRLNYYGYPLPNTVYAKSLGLHPRAFIEGAHYLYTSATTLGGVALLLVGSFVVVWRVRALRYAYLLAAVLAYAAFTFAGGGDWMPAQRFLVHVLPAVVVLASVGLQWLADQFEARQRAYVLGGVAGAQVVFLLMGSADLFLVRRVVSNNVEYFDSALLSYITSNLRSGESIAVNDAGLISYLLPLDVRVIDMFGLADAHIAHLKPRFPSGLLGWGDAFGKWDTDYVLAQKPKLIQLTLYPSPEGDGFVSPHTSNRELLADVRFQQQYRPVSDTLPLRALYQRITP